MIWVSSVIRKYMPGMIWVSSVIRKYMPGMIWVSSVVRKCRYLICLSHGCLRMCFYTSWQNLANMRSPAKMAITARTVSKFRARTRSEWPEIVFLDLKSWVISGIIEPRSECKPERIDSILGVWSSYIIWPYDSSHDGTRATTGVHQNVGGNGKRHV